MSTKLIFVLLLFMGSYIISMEQYNTKKSKSTPKLIELCGLWIADRIVSDIKNKRNLTELKIDTLNTEHTELKE